LTPIPTPKPRYYTDPDKPGCLLTGRRDSTACRQMIKILYGRIPPGYVAAHTCDNGHLGCVAQAHLELIPHSQNIKDAYARGRKRPTSGPGRRLTKDEAAAIKALRAAGYRVADVVKLLGLTNSTVVSQITGRYWHRNVRPMSLEAALAFVATRAPVAA
jgi:hypothetical protein